MTCFFSTRRKPIIAPGFTSFTMALCFSSDAAGVRASRKSSPVCAKPMADFASSGSDGLSSLCVYGMFSPIPPVPVVPTFT